MRTTSLLDAGLMAAAAVAFALSARALAGDDPVSGLRSDDAGWQVDARLRRIGGVEAELTISIRTARGEPVVGASVEAAVRPIAAAAVLAEVGGGSYHRSVTVPIDDTGSHVVELRVRHDTDHYASARAVTLEP
jgi:hypothetical protein